MPHCIATVCLLVHDQDRALDFFVRALRFELHEDFAAPGQPRWLVVAPPGGAGARLQLALATTPAQQASVGRQAGDGVFAILQSRDFTADHAQMRAAGVRFVEAPRDEPYGRVAIFEDLYGNRWDLIQPALNS